MPLLLLVALAASGLFESRSDENFKLLMDFALSRFCKSRSTPLPPPFMYVWYGMAMRDCEFWRLRFSCYSGWVFCGIPFIIPRCWECGWHVAVRTNIRHCLYVGSMLGQRLRRWPNIEPTYKTVTGDMPCRCLETKSCTQSWDASLSTTCLGDAIHMLQGSYVMYCAFRRLLHASVHVSSI